MRLINALEMPAEHEFLSRTRDSDDLLTLKILSELPEMEGCLNSPQDVRLLWDVCQIPDFRNVSPVDHTTLLARIFGFLQKGRVPIDWLAKAVAGIDKTQ